MIKLIKVILAVLACTSVLPLLAQDTNALKTIIGSFETRTGVILIKGVGQVGTLPLDSVQLSVRSKETTDVNTGEKVYGLTFEIESGQWQERLLVDDDELDGLLSSANYLARINNDVTPLPAFEAVYCSKAGLRLIARGQRREGGVLTFIQMADGPRVPVSGVQMTQLCNLLQQARKSLDALKAGK